MTSHSILENFPLLTSNDFWIGAATVLVTFGIPKIVGLFYYPSIASIRSKANAAVRPLGDDHVITVWGFYADGRYPANANGIADQSSFTGRVEYFLRLHNIAYVKKATNMLSESPRGMVPVANVLGKMCDDSARIVSAIKERCAVAEPKLTPDQETTGRLVSVLCTSSLSRVLYHFMFLTEEGRRIFWDDMKGPVPVPLRPLIRAMIFRQQANKLILRGVATTPIDEIYDGARRDLKALNHLVEQQTKLGFPYILGTLKPTEADIDVYTFVGLIFYDRLYNTREWSVRMKKEFPSLLKYTDRLRKVFYPDGNFE